MRTDFHIGDVVELRSGGPAMTVASATADHQLHCVWFDGADLKSGAFPPFVLRDHEAAAADPRHP